jgi:hypothetical protein
VIKRIKNWFFKFLFRQEGGKRVLNRKKAGVLLSVIFAVGLVAKLIPEIRRNENPSEIKRSDAPLVGASGGTVVIRGPVPGSSPIGGVTDNAPKRRGSRGGPHVALKYRAKQVIGPSETSQDHIPRGSNFIGKLISSIDTRAPSQVKVVLPYGGSPKTGGGSLPPETVLFGQAGYPGQGEKVYVNFDRGLLPDGQEIAIHAQALTSKDYTPGIIGDFHGNTSNRMASVLGLTMISGMSDVMVEKEGLGQSFEASPKATLKNGFYNGVTKVTEMEATSQAEKLAQTPEYVTVDSGSDVIISITESFGQNERQ